LFSLSAFQHFENLSLPFLLDSLFIIETPSNLDLSCVLNCFRALASLFDQKTEIDINFEDIQIFQFLGESLDNRSLILASKKSKLNKPSKFKLNFTRFYTIPKQILNSLNSCTIIVNNHSFNCNSSYVACFSKKIFQKISESNSISEFEFSISNEAFNLFKSFILLLQGIELTLDDTSLATLIEPYHAFEIDCLSKFIDQFIPPLTSQKKSLNFIQSNDSILFETKFTDALTNISKKFSTLDDSEIEKIPHPILNQLLDSPTLFVSDEDTFLNKVQNLVKKDKNNFILLSKVKLPFVSCQSVENFFGSLHVNDIDFELFKSIKKCLFVMY
jgi:hypothetical protein